MTRSSIRPHPPALPPQSAGPEPRARKPRIMVAGEFSAGKTRLINGLLGSEVLPSNVTATALPPVWLFAGNGRKWAVDLAGEMREIGSLDEVTVEDTHYCALSHCSELLEHVDIIDTPGNADPNIPSECWERMLDYADAIIWCTNATQAWRQSEKSVWNEMPEHLADTATLVVTHADRMTDAHSAARVLRRVHREAGRYFETILMVSLLEEAGLTQIREALDTMLTGLETLDGEECPIIDTLAERARDPDKETTPTRVIPRRVRPKNATLGMSETQAEASAHADDPAAETAPDDMPARTEAVAPGGPEAGADVPDPEDGMMATESAEAAETDPVDEDWSDAELANTDLAGEDWAETAAKEPDHEDTGEDADHCEDEIAFEDGDRDEEQQPEAGPADGEARESALIRAVLEHLETEDPAEERDHEATSAVAEDMDGIGPDTLEEVVPEQAVPAASDDAAAEDPGADMVAPADLPADLPSAEVLFLSPSGAASGGVVRNPRALWEELSSEIDRSDAAAVLACVERLLAELTGTPAPPIAPEGDPADQGDSTHALVKSMMRWNTQ